MKKLFFLISVNLIASAAIAQFKINLVLSNTPPATLTEWGNRREVLTLIVNAQGSTGGGGEAKIKTEIKTLDGTVIGTTDLAKARTFLFNTATTILTANDVVPLENMIFNGKYRTSLNKTGKLPADNYTLCVQLVRPVDYTPSSDQQCKNFYLATTQLPILMKPYNEEVLDAKAAQSTITFRWTPLIPKPKEPVTYRIQVFEVQAYQTPMQALRGNQPILDQEVKGATQYIWRPQMLFDDQPNELKAQNNNTVKSNRGTEYRINGEDNENDSAQLKVRNNNTIRSGREESEKKQKSITENKKIFIWTIQTLDVFGNPATQTDGNGEARSEPVIFYVAPDSKPIMNQKDKPKEPKIKGIKDTIKTQV